MEKLQPKLRFPEFEGDWNKNKLFQLSENGFSNGIFNDPKKVGKGYKLINVKDMYVGDSIDVDSLSLVDIGEKEFIKNKVEYGDIFFTRSSIVKEGIAHSNVNLSSAKDITYDGHLIRMRPNKRFYLPLFLAYNFKTRKVRNQLVTRGKTSTMTTIGQEDIASVEIVTPTLPEQIKIAEFLTAIDKRIDLLTTKKEKLTLYKKGVMQKIFNQELRFKDENGKEFPEWEEKKLEEIAERVTRKNRENNLNVLTISAQQGLISQLEYFNKSVSAKDVSNYYLLEKDEFAYNKSYSAGYPMGAIKRLLRYDFGVVSTLYICFKFKSTVSRTFMEQYFEAGLQNVEIEKVAQEGVRNHGLLNIGVKDFFGISLNIPSKKEQIRIAQFMISIDSQIQKVDQQITLNQTYKKGLLQQLFL